MTVALSVKALKSDFMIGSGETYEELHLIKSLTAKHLNRIGKFILFSFQLLKNIDVLKSHKADDAHGRLKAIYRALEHPYSFFFQFGKNRKT